MVSVLELAPTAEASPRIQTALYTYGPYFIVIGWENDIEDGRDCPILFSTMTSFSFSLPEEELMVVAEHEYV